MSKEHTCVQTGTTCGFPCYDGCTRHNEIVIKKFNGRNILNIEWRPLDRTKLTLKEYVGISWIYIETREAEDLGLIPSTLRQRHKSQKQIDKEELYVKIYQVIRSFILLIGLIYSIYTKNVVGLGLFSAFVLMSVYLPFIDPVLIDKYEKRK